MDIKTITCHDVYNAGASLQAYALSEYLRNLGNDVRIIDYKPDYLSRHYKIFALANPRFDKPVVKQLYFLAKLPGRLKAKYGGRKRNFDRFRKQFLLLTRRYSSYDELKNEPPDADVYFAGSDQIWNTIFYNGRDPAFYLGFAPNCTVKASYAASFASDTVDEKYFEMQKKWIESIDYISVREASALSILKSMGIYRGCHVLDPVFLLSAQEWSAICKTYAGKDRYVLVYDFDGNSQIEKCAKSLSVKYGIKIYSLQKLAYADKVIGNAGPLEFLSLVKNADYVLSNSFHATAFSLIFHKPFMVFDRNEKINSRMRDLIRSLELENRTNADESIDWNRVWQLLDVMIEQSKGYISKVLEQKIA